MTVRQKMQYLKLLELFYHNYGHLSLVLALCFDRFMFKWTSINKNPAKLSQIGCQ